MVVVMVKVFLNIADPLEFIRKFQNISILSETQYTIIGNGTVRRTLTTGTSYTALQIKNVTYFIAILTIERGYRTIYRPRCPGPENVQRRHGPHKERCRLHAGRLNTMHSLFIEPPIADSEDGDLKENQYGPSPAEAWSQSLSHKR